jgi:hypothetical protein
MMNCRVTTVTVKDKLMSLTVSECERKLFERWLSTATCMNRRIVQLPFENAVHRIGHGGKS